LLLTGVFQIAGWQKYSHEQYGLPAWGASGPYQQVYEKFGITGSSRFSDLSYMASRDNFIYFPDIAVIGKKVIAFYKKKGGEIVSPMVKAL